MPIYRDQRTTCKSGICWHIYLRPIIFHGNARFWQFVVLPLLSPNQQPMSLHSFTTRWRNRFHISNCVWMIELLGMWPLAKMFLRRQNVFILPLPTPLMACLVHNILFGAELWYCWLSRRTAYHGIDCESRRWLEHQPSPHILSGYVNASLVAEYRDETLSHYSPPNEH